MPLKILAIPHQFLWWANFWYLKCNIFWNVKHFLYLFFSTWLSFSLETSLGLGQFMNNLFNHAKFQLFSKHDYLVSYHFLKSRIFLKALECVLSSKLYSKCHSSIMCLLIMLQQKYSKWHLECQYIGRGKCLTPAARMLLGKPASYVIVQGFESQLCRCYQPLARAEKVWLN